MGQTVYIDQSRKVEESGSTVLACSNDIGVAIVVRNRVKKAAIRALKASGGNRKVVHLVFAAAVWLLLREHIDHLERIVIDTEYTGKEAEIRELLLRRIREERPAFEDWQIEFAQIGKKSRAHELANRVRESGRGDYRYVNESEMLEALQ